MIKRNSGQALIYVGLLLLAFVSMAALVVDGARLYFSARETQVAADAAAIGGMLRLIETGNTSDAVAGAQQSAALNTVNGQPATIDDTSNIVVGHWSCSPAGSCTPTFAPGLPPYNAVRTTPSYSISCAPPPQIVTFASGSGSNSAWYYPGCATSCGTTEVTSYVPTACTASC